MRVMARVLFVLAVRALLRVLPSGCCGQGAAARVLVRAAALGTCLQMI